MLRWWHERPRAVTAAPKGAPAPAVIGDEERRLLETVRQTADPPEPAKIRRGLEARAELGLLYLEEDRLDEAERLFADMQAHAPSAKVYGILGKLGLALTRAFQKRPAESNELFLELVQEKVLAERLMPPDKTADEKRLAPRWFFNNDPQLRRMIAQAVELNYRADPAAFPRELDPLRRIPVVPRPGGSRPKSTAPTMPRNP
jgi:hypothetical protein